jgi:Arc/MetJ family transcription regulator
MKKEYDFSGAVRGPVLTPAPGKTRITIRIDDDILRWFRGQVHAAGGGNYQSQINSALREFIQRQNHGLQDALRAVIRQELGRYEMKRSPVVPARSNNQMQLTRSARGKPARGPRS